MAFDWTINFSVIIAFAVLVGGAISAYAVWRHKVGALEESFKAYKAATDIRLAAVDAALKFHHDRAEEIRSKCSTELSDFRIEVAKDYAGHVALREMESRVMRAIEGLGQRIDKLTDARRDA